MNDLKCPKCHGQLRYVFNNFTVCDNCDGTVPKKADTIQDDDIVTIKPYVPSPWHVASNSSHTSYNYAGHDYNTSLTRITNDKWEWTVTTSRQGSLDEKDYFLMVRAAIVHHKLEHQIDHLTYTLDLADVKHISTPSSSHSTALSGSIGP